MTPMLFGPPERQLMGLFHPAEHKEGQPRLAVLLCPPLGQEQIRTQRLFRVLADRLTRSGIDAFRFDYYGTGDSGGDEEEGEFEGWQRDIAAAHAQLQQLCGGTVRTVWLGARLGASLAALAAHAAPHGPARMVLWDPVVNGAAYLDELRAAHVDAIEQSYCIPERDLRRRLAQDPDAFTDDLIGFAASPLLRHQLRALSAQRLPLAPLDDTTVLADPGDGPVVHWVDGQRSRELPVQLSPFQHPLIWTSDPHPNNAMVPAEVLQRLQAELRE